MDLARTQLSGLLNNVHHEKTRFMNILHKLKAILNLCKDSKLILTPLDKLILTSSPRIIFENLSFSHPILKILIEFIQKTRKLGEGERLFVEVLKKLLDEVNFLLENGIKPKTISNRLKDIVLDKSAFTTPGCSLAESMANLKLSDMLNEEVRGYISRMLGVDTVSRILIEAIEHTQSFDSEKIRVCKILSGSLEDSYRADGMLLTRLPEGSVRSATSTSVGIFNCPLDINRTELKGTVLLHNSGELLNFTKEETEMIRSLVDSLNVNVLIVSGTINELFMDFADARRLLVLKIHNKYDLKRICDLVGGSIYNTLGPVSSKGHVEKIEVIRDAGCEFTKLVAPGHVTTIVLKSSIREMCDEMERKILSTLENLQLHSSDRDLAFTGAEFFETIAKQIGAENVVTARISAAISGMQFDSMIAEDAVRCLKYSLDFLATILEIDDYLVAKADQLDVKPQSNPHWDDD